MPNLLAIEENSAQAAADLRRSPTIRPPLRGESLAARLMKPAHQSQLFGYRIVRNEAISGRLEAEDSNAKTVALNRSAILPELYWQGQALPGAALRLLFMDIEFLAKGLVIGLSVAAPVGPIGVLCIRRTLANGRASGFVTGLGAATADATYGAIAAFGLTAISDALVDNGSWFRLIGGVALLYLGLRTFRSRPADSTSARERGDLARDYASSLGLTLTNPATILSFAAIFAGLGLADEGADYGSAGAMVAGVLAGSASWWFILSVSVSLTRSRLDPYLSHVNRLSGLVIGGFGLAALASLVV